MPEPSISVEPLESVEPPRPLEPPAALDAPALAVAVGFSTPRGLNPISWLIRKISGSRASHAWLRFHDPLFGLDLVMEAHSSGMRLVAMKVFEKDNRVVAIAHPQCDFAKALHRAAGWLGAPYDYEGLLGMSWVMVGRFLRRKFKNPWADRKAYFCSEAVVTTLREAGFPDADELTAQATSPQDLLEFLEKHPDRCPIQFTRARRGRAAAPGAPAGA